MLIWALVNIFIPFPWEVKQGLQNSFPLQKIWVTVLGGAQIDGVEEDCWKKGTHCKITGTTPHLESISGSQDKGLSHINVRGAMNKGETGLLEKWRRKQGLYEHLCEREKEHGRL